MLPPFAILFFNFLILISKNNDSISDLKAKNIKIWSCSFFFKYLCITISI